MIPIAVLTVGYIVTIGLIVFLKIYEALGSGVAAIFPSAQGFLSHPAGGFWLDLALIVLGAGSSMIYLVLLCLWAAVLEVKKSRAYVSRI